MIYNGRGVQVVPGLGVGFDEAGQAVIQGQPGQPQPDGRQVLEAVHARREALLREVALLTAWVEAATTPPKSAIIVAPAGAVPVNGHGPIGPGPRRVR